MQNLSEIILGVTFLLFFALTGAQAQPPRQGVGEGPNAVARLAERGDARAQTRLGFMLATGQGVPQDFAHAAYWYRRAAEQGEPNAQYLLGVCFDLATGVAPDLVEAHKWLNLSASRTRPGAEREHRARMRDAIATKLNRLQLQQAQWLAASWRPKPER